MNRDGDKDNIFTPGAPAEAAPIGDPQRQAINSLRGYAHQVAASTLAWLDLEEKGRLYLEVAEDYATVAGNALNAVQVKDTVDSGSVTLNTESARDVIHAFVELAARNPGRSVSLRYLTTSPIGTERLRVDRPAGEAGLEYWRKAASGADIAPLRSLLEREDFSKSVREYVRARDDNALRTDLLRKIHWDCSQPDMASIRRELEERSIVLGRDRFGLPDIEARRLVDVLMYHVLQKCVLKNANERVLTRAELYSVIDGATRQSVPRATVDAMAQLATALASVLPGGPTAAAFSTSNISWLIASIDLPPPRSIIARPPLEAAIAKALEARGLAVLVGGTGLGKSLLARAIVAKDSSGFAIIDLRDVDASETRRRLDSLLGRIGGLDSRLLVFEDLDHFDDAGVSLSLGRVVEALHRRDRICLVTSHRRPSVRTLTQLGLDASDVIEVPYFSELEAAEVVRAAGGDPKIWGRLSYVAGAHGHPQLVHAFAIGMAARGWPAEAKRDVVIRGFSSDDIVAAQEAARRSLTVTSPDETRTLLYRLSLVIGRFDRSLALDIGSLPPSIANAGERLNELVGPWIEAIGSNHYRVSPLANRAGLGMLTADEQRRIHELIATRLLARRTIDASDASIVLVHALAGKSAESLVTLARMVMSTDKDLLPLLGEHLFMLRMLRTDQLIYPESPAVSRMLRLAQFRLVAETKKGPDILACATALLNEVDQESDAQSRAVFEYLALLSVLTTRGIADYLANWINLLHRLKAIIEADSKLQRLQADFERATEEGGASFYGMLFAIGATGISSVARLEEIIGGLNALHAEERSLWLCVYDHSPGDYGLLVNGPWLAEHNRKAINPDDAAARYKRLAERAESWSVPELAARCHAARAVMLDEYGNDKDAALRALDEGVAALGENVVLSRARAKIFWRHDNFAAVVNILRRIADLVGQGNPIERAFAMREAAISAAKTDDWRQAEIWFAEGETAAAAAHTVDMQAMAIGLGADAAVAAIKIGKQERGLRRFVDALVGLKDLDPSASLRAAYCHRVVRHTVLWTKSQLSGVETRIDGEPIQMLPGTCSNPDPPASIRELPLAHLDLAWYMLAEAEIASSSDARIIRSLHARLTQGPIPVGETMLRNQWLASAIARLDASGFASHIHGWLEGVAFLHANSKALRENLDPSSPIRGDIPSLPRDALAEDYLQASAVDANLAFCIVAALNGKAEAITVLEAQLVSQFGNEFPGSVLFEYWQGAAASLGRLDKICAEAIGLLRTGQHIEPRRLWEMALRLFEKARQPSFRAVTTHALAGWLRVQWLHVLEQERFRLSQPRLTVPAIEAALASEHSDESFVAALLLATSDAVRASLAASYRDELQKMARGATTTQGNQQSEE